MSEKTEGTLREMFVRKTKQKQNTLYILVMFFSFLIIMWMPRFQETDSTLLVHSDGGSVPTKKQNNLYQSCTPCGWVLHAHADID